MEFRRAGKEVHVRPTSTNCVEFKDSAIKIPEVTVGRAEGSGTELGFERGVQVAVAISVPVSSICCCIRKLGRQSSPATRMLPVFIIIATAPSWMRPEIIVRT